MKPCPKIVMSLTFFQFTVNLGLCKTSYKTCEGDIDFMGTFPNTQLQSQPQLLLDMANIEDLTSYAPSIPGTNKITNISDRTKRQEVPYARMRSNNILQSNSFNKTNLTVVLENATIIDTKPTSLTSKQNVAGSS